MSPLSISSIMESLSTECTPLKHRYDSCFNSWFEGYLQPALDGDATRIHVQPAQLETPSPSIPHSALPGPSRPPQRIITNWSSAFPSNTPQPMPTGPPVREPRPIPAGDSVQVIPTDPIDTRGKSRNQIKAEEYERRCGSAWRSYQTCLKRAIQQNQSLATLLDQARDEHPLKDQSGLKGTVWDPEYVPEA